MSSTDFVLPPPRISFAEVSSAWIARLPRPVRILATVAILTLAGYQLDVALQSPAHIIKHELVAAAEQTGALPWKRSVSQVEQAVGGYFQSHAATIDATKFPTQVAVALDGIDRNTCLEARTLTRRIEGSVVVALDGYRSDAECGDRNRMTWRIMP
jgi:hypothetical protein